MPFEHEEDSGLKHETRLNYPTRINEMEYLRMESVSSAAQRGVQKGMGMTLMVFFFFSKEMYT